MQSSTSLMDNTARKDPDSTQVCVRALGVFAGTRVLLCNINDRETNSQSVSVCLCI